MDWLHLNYWWVAHGQLSKYGWIPINYGWSLSARSLKSGWNFTPKAQIRSSCDPPIYPIHTWKQVFPKITSQNKFIRPQQAADCRKSKI